MEITLGFLFIGLLSAIVAFFWMEREEQVRGALFTDRAWQLHKTIFWILCSSFFIGFIWCLISRVLHIYWGSVG